MGNPPCPRCGVETREKRVLTNLGTTDPRFVDYECDNPRCPRFGRVVDSG